MSKWCVLPLQLWPALAACPVKTQHAIRRLPVSSQRVCWQPLVVCDQG